MDIRAARAIENRVVDDTDGKRHFVQPGRNRHSRRDGQHWTTRQIHNHRG